MAEQMKSRRTLFIAGGTGTLIVAALAAAALAPRVGAADAAQPPAERPGTAAEVDPWSAGEDAPVTFSGDVASILQRRCQACHQVGSIAPMSLVTYEETRPWGPLIRDRVTKRIMPPWHLDRDRGIQAFANDRSLTDEEIATLVRWVDAGMPEGDPAELPPPVEWPDGRNFALYERLGPPDLIVRSDPYDVPATGQDAWWRPTVETGVERPRWVRAAEVKPSYPDGRKVVHHTLVTLLQSEEGITGLASSAAGAVGSPGLLTEWAIGKVGEVYPENTGKLLLPGSRIRFEVHYSTMAGIEVPDNQVELGLWFYPEGVTPKYRTILRFFNIAGDSELEIPPHTLTTHSNSYVIPAPARLESFQPHMHMRGRGMSMEALYPDGRKELLNIVSAFQWKWHNNYIYAPEAAPLLPAGTVLQFTAWHDNTASNPANPDPDQYVTWGDRTVDEMAHAWVGITYLEQADFDRLAAERAAARDRVAANR